MIGVWARWETALCAVFQILVGAFLASTGMAASMGSYAAERRSDTAGTDRFKDVDLVRGLITLRGETTKSG
jgi:hypothetical protein